MNYSINEGCGIVEGAWRENVCCVHAPKCIHVIACVMHDNEFIVGLIFLYPCPNLAVRLKEWYRFGKCLNCTCV